jgi:hypothetical protein
VFSNIVRLRLQLSIVKVKLRLLCLNRVEYLELSNVSASNAVAIFRVRKKAKAVPLHATLALGGRGDIAATHYRPRH